MQDPFSVARGSVRSPEDQRVKQKAGSSVHVASMAEDDVKALAKLYEESFGVPAPGTMQESAEDQLRQEWDRPYARIWVARFEDVGDPVGFLLAWSIADELSVHHVATRSDCRRRGIGRALMVAALKHLQDHQGRWLLLEVRRSNVAARSLYRAVGMFVTALRRAYYPDGEDAVEMALEWDAGARVPIHHPDEVDLQDDDPFREPKA